MSVSYLLDAETDGDAVKLKFYDMSAGEIKEFKDSEYKPYFLTSYPLSKKDEYTLERIVGKASTVEKHDLFTDKKRIMTKIEIKNPNNLERFSRMFENVWENEIEFSRGCVYDHGLVFGSPYILHGNRFIEASTISEDIKKKFESIFALIRTSDPLKYSLLEYWFNLCHQPIPQVEPEILGISGKADPERFYLAFMLARIANLPVSEAYSSRRVSDWIKSIIYTYLRRNNILVPTSKELRRGAQLKRSVAGALTIAPRSGVYFNTVVTDFESLYPSCIDSYNLSYETVDCEHTECESNTVSEAGHHVCTRRRGFYSALIGALKDMRIHWFKPLSKNPNIPDDKRRLAEASAKLLKLITVSSYGVTVRIHGLASTPLAESITGYGRYVLQTSWNMAEVNGLRPTYGDTDSLFLHNPSEEQVKWLIKTVKEKLRLDLAVEKRYSVCVLPKAKKAYFGILEDGAPDIKGLTVIKSNSPEFFLHVFRDCVKELSHVKNMEEYEEAKERIVGVVEELSLIHI